MEYHKILEYFLPIELFAQVWLQFVKVFIESVPVHVIQPTTCKSDRIADASAEWSGSRNSPFGNQGKRSCGTCATTWRPATEIDPG